MAKAAKGWKVETDWRQQQELEERYHTEPVCGPWTQADIDLHRALRKELKEIIEELENV